MLLNLMRSTITSKLDDGQANDAKPHSSVAGKSASDGCRVGVSGGVGERSDCSSEHVDVAITSSLLSFLLVVLCKYTTPGVGQPNQCINIFEMSSPSRVITIE